MAEECDEADHPGGVDDETLLILGTNLAEVDVDGQRVKERSVAELIALDKHLAGKRAACVTGSNGWGSVGVARAVPPDAAGVE